MKLSNECRFCGNHVLTTIDTYKHRWHSCNDCGNIVRQPKEVLALDRLPAGVLNAWKAVPKLRAIPSMLARKPQGADFYLNANTGQALSSKGTKWEGQFARVQQELARVGVGLEGKELLDVSGGPGFFYTGRSHGL